MYCLKHVLTQALLGPVVCAKHLGMFGTDDEDRWLGEWPPVGTPRARCRPREDVSEIFRRAAAVIGNRQRRVTTDERDDRLARREASFDVQRGPRTDLLILGDTEADLAHVTERGPVERSWHSAPGQLDHEAKGPANRQVCSVTGTEYAHAAVEAEFVADRTVDHDQLPGRLGG